jgi:hypothetical protein
MMMKTKDLRTKVTAKYQRHIGQRPAFVTVPPSYGRESTREPITTRTTDEEPEVEGRRPRLIEGGDPEVKATEGNDGEDDDGRRQRVEVTREETTTETTRGEEREPRGLTQAETSDDTPLP